MSGKNGQVSQNQILPALIISTCSKLALKLKSYWFESPCGLKCVYRYSTRRGWYRYKTCGGWTVMRCWKDYMFPYECKMNMCDSHLQRFHFLFCCRNLIAFARKSFILSHYYYYGGKKSYLWNKQYLLTKTGEKKKIYRNMR